jgi:hypothetical protein
MTHTSQIGLRLLEHPHPCHSLWLHKWVPHIFLYYFTFFHSLNHSTNFSKYQYHSSKNLNWVPLIPLYIQIMHLLTYKIKKKKCKSKIVQQSTVSMQNHGSKFGHSNSYQLSNTHWHKFIGLCVTTPNVNRYWCS